MVVGIVTITLVIIGIMILQLVLMQGVLLVILAITVIIYVCGMDLIVVPKHIIMDVLLGMVRLIIVIVQDVFQVIVTSFMMDTIMIIGGIIGGNIITLTIMLLLPKQ
jgi:hypothetical protein